MTAHWRPGRKQLLLLLVSAAALYIVLPQIGVFRHSLSVLPQAERPALALAVAYTFATYLLAALTYVLLALQPLRFGRTLLVQVAGLFTNHLLPAGIGGIGVSYVYLRHARHTTTQATTVVAANNMLGLVGHVLLTGSILAVWHGELPGWRTVWRPHIQGWEYWLAAASLAAVLLLSYWYGRRVRRALSAIARQLWLYRRQPLRLSAALLSSMSLTLCNILSLYYCVVAFHIPLSFVSVLLVFSLGILLGTATPTPGGLGGVEAGLVAGMVALHIPAAHALTAVLVYRFISYWLAIVVGAAALVVVVRRGYLELPAKSSNTN